METPGSDLDAGRHDQRHDNCRTNPHRLPSGSGHDPPSHRASLCRHLGHRLGDRPAARRDRAVPVRRRRTVRQHHRESRKARNIAGHGVAAVTIAVRRLPIGPPASIQFQCSAAVLANDDPEIIRLAAAGRLDRITGHGELTLDGACFLRLALPTRVITYALGMSLWRAMRNPLDAAGELNLLGSRPSARTTPT